MRQSSDSYSLPYQDLQLLWAGSSHILGFKDAWPVVHLEDHVQGNPPLLLLFLLQTN